MNVSSVKNLNGETFSAVQDATLTNVVQTNSGTWNTVSGKLDTSALPEEEEVEFEEIDLSSFATSSQISALSGAIDYVSANVGDEFPVSADEAVQYVQTNSAGIDDTVSNVQTNSGAWGKVSANAPLSGNGSNISPLGINPDVILPYPMKFVSTSAAATGTNILYVVTGGN